MKIDRLIGILSVLLQEEKTKKMEEMLKYYSDKGCEVLTLKECMREKEA